MQDRDGRDIDHSKTWGEGVRQRDNSERERERASKRQRESTRARVRYMLFNGEARGLGQGMFVLVGYGVGWPNMREFVVEARLYLWHAGEPDGSLGVAECFFSLLSSVAGRINRVF